ncbi:hypothetical protein WL99_20085 [Burkholderia cepacia]|uniref:hypothetical protein n=1 Tax=Burkholderia cepacia TaxID=292 RepID=UPI000752117E|nr:hypothetical protein [Burkholderia cepacia]KWH27655.1 hypothetical protein WL99_20085 [Burkholderia cepacia]
MTAELEKSARKPRSLDDEIERTAAKLKRLQEQQRERVRKDRERNQKDVLELLRAEGLDAVPAEQWKARLDAVKVALTGSREKVPGEQNAPAAPAAAAAAEGAVV